MGDRLRYGAMLAVGLVACGGALPPARPISAPPLRASATAELPRPAPAAPAEDLWARVARLRGLTPKRAVPIDYLDDDAFDAEYAATVPVSDELRARTAATWVAFGFVGREVPATANVAASARSTAFSGFYDPKRGRVFMRRRPTEDGNGLLVHELTHALQDQYFDLQAFARAPDDDAMLAHKATFEGDATLVSEVWGASQAAEDPGVSVVRASARASNLPEEDILQWIGAEPTVRARPAVAWRPMVFAYYTGMSFLSALRPPYDFSAVDRAFRDPPSTTEQVLHPEKYAAREAPLPLALASPPNGIAAAASGTLGEYRTFVMLLRCLPRAVAAQASAGWGSDQFAVGSLGGGRVGLTWSTRWDTEADAREFADALRAASRCYPEQDPSGLRIDAADAIAVSGDRVVYVRGYAKLAAVAAEVLHPILASTGASAQRP